jgi:hypothetical protein
MMKIHREGSTDPYIFNYDQHPSYPIGTYSFTPGEEAPGTHRTGEQMDLRVILDLTVKKRIHTCVTTPQATGSYLMNNHRSKALKFKFLAIPTFSSFPPSKSLDNILKSAGNYYLLYPSQLTFTITTLLLF